jgi:hypothetical protein
LDYFGDIKPSFNFFGQYNPCIEGYLHFKIKSFGVDLSKENYPTVRNRKWRAVRKDEGLSQKNLWQ